MILHEGGLTSILHAELSICLQPACLYAPWSSSARCHSKSASPLALTCLQMDQDTGDLTQSVAACARAISRRVAADVIKTAYAEGKLNNKSALRELLKGDQCLLEWVESKMYRPQYDSLIHLPVGIME